MNAKKTSITFLFFALAVTINAQETILVQGNKTFTIQFINALTGDPVSGAEIMIENTGTFSTDSAGRVIFPQQPDGSIKAIFRKDGFISAIYAIDITSETILRNRFMVSPTMNAEQFRFVLSWDKQPEDLDAHFFETNSYHISYRNTRVLNDGTGQLDRDDMDGYGPESITVSQLDPESEYSFYVYKYFTKKNPSTYPLGNSKATVWVFGSNRLLNIFHIPPNIKEDKWQVFKIKQGQIIEGE